MASPTSRVKRPNPARDHRDKLERQAFELSKHCPVDRSNPVDCPLFGLRPLPARERRTWIRGLSDAELEYLAKYHTCCHAVRAAAR